MKKTIIVDFTVLLFIIIFLYTGLSKLLNHRDFIYTLGWWKQLRPLAGFISYFLPLLEIAIAVLLLFERYKRRALTASMALMLIFIFYIVFMKIYATDLPCSCGGIVSSLTWDQHLALNIALVVLSILSIYILKDKRSTIDNHHSEQARDLPLTDSPE